jgi:hypothetical protein
MILTATTSDGSLMLFSIVPWIDELALPYSNARDLGGVLIGSILEHFWIEPTRSEIHGKAFPVQDSTLQITSPASALAPRRSIEKF